MIAKGKKILIVDDNPHILEAVELILSSEDYQVKTLLKGDETHKTAVSYKPDLIILDLLLSGRDGREITKEMKKDNATRDIPIVIISAHPTAKQAAKDAGADGFLEKPFDVEEMLSLVGKLTNHIVS